MKVNYIKLFYICLLSNLILIYSLPMILGNESRVVIGEDDIDDLRKFEGDWLAEEFDDSWWEFDDERVDDVYAKIARHWDDEEACEPLYNPDVDGPDNPEEYKDYTDYTYIDIFKIEVRDLDKDTAVMVVRVKGDAGDADEPWALFIWSDCTGDTEDNIYFVAISAPDGIGGEDVDGYSVRQGNKNETGSIDYESDGSDIELDFDPNMWKDVKECNIYAMMLTPKSEKWDEDEEPDIIIELFPKGEYIRWLDFWFWFWLLIICLITLAAVIFIYYWYKKRKKSKGSSKKQV